MTTQTIVPRALYAANGVQTAFAFTFPVFEAQDMEVWVDQSLQSGSAYTVSGVGVAVGGTVIFTVPPPASSQVTLRRRIPLNRTPEFPDTSVQAKPLNEEFTYHTAALQQLADETSLAVKRSFRSLSTADLTLPEPVAGRSIRWNDTGDGMVNSAADADSILAQSAAHALACAADADATAADRIAVTAAASAAASDRTVCDADVVVTGADRAQVASDKAVVAADRASVAADRTSVAADRAAADADAAATASDRLTVAADRASAQAAAAAATASQSAAQASELSASGSASAALASEANAAASASTAQAAANIQTFKTISVAGQSDVVADQAGDTLTLAAGSNVTLSTDVSTDTVTIAVSGLATVAASGAYADLSGRPDQETITAGETLASGEAIYLDDGNLRGGGATKWYKIDTDATDPVKIGRTRGIALAAIASGNNGSAQTGSGVVTGLSGLTAGQLIYASGTAGAMTQTEPSVPTTGTQNAVVILGRALSTTAMQFEPWHDVVFQARDSALASASSITVEHWTDGGARERIARGYINASTQSQIAQGTGTAIGDMTEYGGLASCFDSSTSQTSSAGAVKGGSPASAGIGKTWSLAKTITGFKTWGASDDGYYNGSSPTITATLKGSDSGFSLGGGTTLGSATITDAPGANIIKLSGLTTSSAYTSHWVEFSSSGSPSQWYCSEVQFFETTSVRDEPLTIGSETVNSAATDRVTVKFADSSDANTNTKTTFYNRTGATRDLIVEVTL